MFVNGCLEDKVNERGKFFISFFIVSHDASLKFVFIGKTFRRLGSCDRDVVMLTPGRHFQIWGRHEFWDVGVLVVDCFVAGV